jgi:hypothetical protein
MTSLHLVKMPKETPVRVATREEIAGSKTQLGYDFGYWRDIYDTDEDDNEYVVRREWRYTTYDAALRDAIQLASAAWSADMRMSTWIVNDDGKVLATVTFVVNVVCFTEVPNA